VRPGLRSWPRANERHRVVAIGCAFGHARLDKRIKDDKAEAVDDEENQKDHGLDGGHAREAVSAKQVTVKELGRFGYIGNYAVSLLALQSPAVEARATHNKARFCAASARPASTNWGMGL
jgi:hypothetical protein